jgi:hypothetical protein
MDRVEKLSILDRFRANTTNARRPPFEFACPPWYQHAFLALSTTIRLDIGIRSMTFPSLGFRHSRSLSAQLWSVSLLVLMTVGCEPASQPPAAPPPAAPSPAAPSPAAPSPAASVGSQPSPVEESPVTTEQAATNSADDSDQQAQAADNSDKVLRHAVFFSFKEESSEADIKGVADAFAALPSKIDSISDFQWGTNNSPEGLDDGFTHCFLLTFKDAAGRDAYIPHPAHSGEFADVLRPHMKDVFVIDYWGSPKSSEIDKELKHAVFFKFKEDASAEDIKKVEDAFAALPSKIDSIKAFEWGINNSPEKHDDGFTHCFMVTFGSEEGRAAYLPHQDHLAFVEVLKPVRDKVRVLDFWEQ